MKKFILILAGLLVSNIAAQAVNWVAIETQAPYSYMLIDTDSIRYSDKTKDYFYAIRFTKYPRAEQVVYLKSDLYKDYIGVVCTEDYDYQTYRPNTMFRSSHAFMKPVCETAFLYPAHKFIASISIDDSEPLSVKKIDKIIGNDDEKYKSSKITDIRSYIKSTNRRLRRNWNTPESAKKTLTTVDIDINRDGNLKDFRFVSTPNDDLTASSIVNAIEQTAPFKDLSSFNKDHMIIQVTFKKGKVVKKVN